MITIRGATDADLPGIFAIYADAVKSSTAIWIDDPGTIEDRRAWLLLRAGQDYPVLIAAEGEAVLGYGSFGDFRPQEGFRGSVEHSLYVTAHARGKGIGRKLLTALIEAAKARGKRVMVAAIDATNEASLSLHRSFGFSETGRMPGVGEKFGKPLELVLLQREL
jgi:L-amino acid N-acyltransferase